CEGTAMRRNGVSIITCTKKPQFIHNVFKNYRNQIWEKKELIIVLNEDSMNLSQWLKQSKSFKNVSIFRLPGKVSLGRCLNFAIQKAKYGFIAKFDDDDFYAPYYLKEAIRALIHSKAAVVGKRTHLAYIGGKKLLIQRFCGRENKFTQLIAGGTIVCRKNVVDRIKFSNTSLGEDVQFLRDCRTRGLRIYSTSKYNYVYVRRPNLKNHTLKVSDQYLLSRKHKIVARTNQFQQLASRMI
ncbi:MAG TPA: glycosyltransferase, partial [Bacillota bacterium]|nr:glycosyltransferase [Bacillota bacterium]